MSELFASLVNAIRNSQLLRVMLISFLVLLLQIPIAMIDGLIGGRTTRHNEAVEEVTGKWGREQTVIGPVLVVPYVVRWFEGEGENRKLRTKTRYGSFLPGDLAIDGRIETEIRSRGIFDVPVYKMTLHVEGWFSTPQFADWGVKSEDILWSRAELWVGISDARAIQSQTSLTWNGEAVPFEPGTGEFGGAASGSGEPEVARSGIHAPLKKWPIGKRVNFSFPLVLNGSTGAFFAPLGEQTTVSLASNWSTPSFQGNWLPAERSVRPDGFQSKWSIPSLGRNYPQRWASDAAAAHEIDKSTFGVQLLAPVDPYRMSERSVKYEALFLMLTFLSLWLFEVLVRRRLHSLQYLLVGAAMCLFYLLLLSLAEHLGFLPAYLLASFAVAGLITAYCASILRKPGWALIVGTLVAALYAYLYVLLNNEDYALLYGSVGLFIILAAVMYLTRAIDWANFVAPGSKRG